MKPTPLHAGHAALKCMCRGRNLARLSPRVERAFRVAHLARVLQRADLGSAAHVARLLPVHVARFDRPERSQSAFARALFARAHGRLREHGRRRARGLAELHDRLRLRERLTELHDRLRLRLRERLAKLHDRLRLRLHDGLAERLLRLAKRRRQTAEHRAHHHGALFARSAPRPRRT
jgi:hypothetical protein